MEVALYGGINGEVIWIFHFYSNFIAYNNNKSSMLPKKTCSILAFVLFAFQNTHLADMEISLYCDINREVI